MKQHVRAVQFESDVLAQHVGAGRFEFVLVDNTFDTKIVVPDAKFWGFDSNQFLEF